MSARQSSLMGIPAVSIAPARSVLLQRKCTCGKVAGPTGECEECKKKRESGPMLQRKGGQAAAPSQVSTEAPPIVHDVLRSPGQPLDSGTRAFMEPRFGYDFSRVRVHADSRAAKSAEAVNAQAYTVGSNVVLGANQGGAGNLSHQRILAHELAHVVQQGGRQPGGSLQVAPANDSAEGAADRAADQVLSGGPASNAVKAEGCLQRLGANPGCTTTQANEIHQAIFDANSMVIKALRALRTTPLATRTLNALKNNFGAAGTAANAGTIATRLDAGRDDMIKNPYACANETNSATCRELRCGYSVGSGNHASTICTNASTTPVVRLACVLHEAMHASNVIMTEDFYSGWFGLAKPDTGYPGASPLINADSYVTLAMELS
jgi:Domain of unknown function (DUF4157)